ncbi:MAG: hypothetical protein ACRD5E_09015 [Nitrososphaeraceae archaeon]
MTNSNDNSSSNNISNVDFNNSDLVSLDQRKEQQRRNEFLKQSIRDANLLYEGLGKTGRAMKIRPEDEYWIFEVKPEKTKEE